MSQMSWAAYSDAQRDRAPRPLCTEVLELAGPGAARVARDLGCGAGVETRALLAAGWRVHAIDSEPGTVERVLEATRDLNQDLLTITCADIAELPDLSAADLVYAGYSLPFVTPENFATMWHSLRTNLEPGGWLAVNLLGDQHSCANNQRTQELAPSLISSPAK